MPLPNGNFNRGFSKVYLQGKQWEDCSDADPDAYPRKCAYRDCDNWPPPEDRKNYCLPNSVVVIVTDTRYLGLEDGKTYLMCRYRTKPIRFYKCWAWASDMRILFLTSIAALLLATGATHAYPPRYYDCGKDTEPWPPHKGTQEHYILRDEIWRQAGMPQGERSRDDLGISGGGTLCIGCLEKRLGRLLTEKDFHPIGLDMLKKGSQSTPRLLSRMGVNFMAITHTPLPDHIVEGWVESTLRNVLADNKELGRGLKDVEVNIEKRARYEVAFIYTEEVPLYRAGPKLRNLIDAMRGDRLSGLGDGEIDLLAWKDDAA